jgi:1-acyl-sn-glycerol-3-phosphate acyltransferase
MTLAPALPGDGVSPGSETENRESESGSRPYLRPLAVWMLCGPALALATITGLLIWPLVGGRNSFWGIAPRFIRCFASAFGIRRTLEGWEALPLPIREGRQPAVFVGNHASLFDPPLIISTLPCQPVFLAKRELRRVPFLGWAMGMAGFIFIDREHRTRARASMVEAARRIRGGQSIAAFPEGTRSLKGAVMPFKKGVFSVVADAQVPIVPFAIRGGAAILPKGTWRVAGGPYLIRMGTPLEIPPGLDADGVRRLAQAAVEELLARP